MTTLIIIANITAQQDKIELVKTALLKLIEITRTEEGCLQYDLHQDNKNPAHFTFFERWTSAEKLQAHLASQHIADYLAATQEAVVEFTLNEMTQLA